MPLRTRVRPAPSTWTFAVSLPFSRTVTAEGGTLAGSRLLMAPPRAGGRPAPPGEARPAALRRSGSRSDELLCRRPRLAGTGGQDERADPVDDAEQAEDGRQRDGADIRPQEEDDPQRDRDQAAEGPHRPFPGRLALAE